MTWLWQKWDLAADTFSGRSFPVKRIQAFILA